MKNKISKLLSLAFGVLVVSNVAFAQSIYFQRTAPTGGAISAVPISGPNSTIDDFYSNKNAALFGGIASNGLGGFYYSDVSANEIHLVDVSGKNTLIVGKSAGLSNPNAIAFDSNEKFLYIADNGNQRLVRVNLSSPLPNNNLEIVANEVLLTAFISDIKYNKVDGAIYWAGLGLLYRIFPAATTLPVTDPESIQPTGDVDFLYFDFDYSSSQSVYFSDFSSDGGIYQAQVPTQGVSVMSETKIFDVSTLDSFLIYGIAVDSNSNTLCFSAINVGTPILGCGDRSNLGAYYEVAQGKLLSISSSLVIDKSLNIARPNTVPEAPAVTVAIANNKPQATLTFEAYAGADTKKQTLKMLKEIEELNAKKEGNKAPKLGIQYYAEIKRPTDADGMPLSKKEQDFRKLTSKKNTLTVKNLKTNSNYEVKYRVEITSKDKNGDTKVVKKTQFSPSTGFLIQ